MSNWFNNKKGFTLVEIVIVIVIIALLTAMLIPSVMRWVEKAKFGAFKDDADTIKTALFMFIVYEYSDKFENYVIDESNADEIVDSDFWEKASNATQFELSPRTNDGSGNLKFRIEYGTVKYLTFYRETYKGTFDGLSWTYEKTDD